MHHCYDLSGLTLPEDSPELRDHVLPESRRTGDYMARYDRRTLIYDLAEAPGGEGWVMTCPRLFNLAPLLDQALPDAQIPPWYRRRRQTLRTSDLRFLRGGAGPLRLRLHGQDHEVAVRPDISAAFAGRNVLMCINKDNDLAWITDWARFHARAHGVNAVVIFDNASTCYAPQSLAARLDGLEGIDQVAVLSARYPYGPAVKRYRRQPSKFLQNALFNMARLTLLARARAVLNVDIDEFVLPLSDVSVFDAAAARRNTFTKIPGSWVYPQDGTQWPCLQVAHLCRAVPDKPAHDKWCAVPSGLMSRFGWDMHKIADEAYRPLPYDRRFQMIHCRATTTGWKKARGASALPERAVDPAIEAALRRFLPERFESAGQGGLSD